MANIKRKIIRTLKQHEILYNFFSQIFHIYKLWHRFKDKQKFYSRVKGINIDNFLDSSNKDDLNIIIISIDCLRRSHLSYNNYFRETTPFLDSIKGSKFNAISPSPWTYPSVASILTGLYPHNHNAIIEGKIKNMDKLENYRKIKKKILTLPEILFLSGYQIYFGVAICLAYYPLKNRVLPNIETFYRAENLFNNLSKWISKRKRPFFAYVHLGDLHEPLFPPNDFKNFFGKVEDIPNINRWDFQKIEEQKGREFYRYRENRILLYDNTLRYVDYAIEQFYGYLEDRGLIDSTILIITADHGEEFWEHAKLEAKYFYDPRGYHGVGHGHNVFKEIIDVPIIISGPKIPNKKFDYLVSGVDIVPTILDLLRINYYLQLDGKNVFKVKKRHLLSEACGYGYEKKALIMGQYKLIFSHYDGVKWVFNTKNDSNEQKPFKEGEFVATLVNKLLQILTNDEKQNIREIIKKRFQKNEI